MRFILISSVVLLACACSEVNEKVDGFPEVEPTTVQENRIDPSGKPVPTDVQAQPTSPKNSGAKSSWSHKVTFLSEGNWGYQLFDGSAMVINQTTIPSIQGTNGFDSREKAEKTAAFIVGKLERGIFPPTVNKQELDSLRVLRN